MLHGQVCDPPPVDQLLVIGQFGLARVTLEEDPMLTGESRSYPTKSRSDPLAGQETFRNG